MESCTAETLKRELRRKSLHLPIFIFPALALYSRSLALGLVIALTCFYLVVVTIEGQAPQSWMPFYNWVNQFKRSRAIDPAPLYLALGVFWCLFTSTPAVTFFAVSILAICDSAAALFGMRYGRHKIGHLSKTWQGSSAFFIFAFLNCIFLLSAPHAFLAALILTVVEIFSTHGTDNLFLPVAAQLLIVWLH